MATTPINIQIHLSVELKNILKKGAETQGVSVGDYLSWMVEAGLRDEATYYNWELPKKTSDIDYAEKVHVTMQRVNRRERKKAKNSRH